MSQGTSLRLDTVDYAFEFGWQVASTPVADEFTKDGCVAVVEYSEDDEIVNILGVESVDAGDLPTKSSETHELLRNWFAGETSRSAKTMTTVSQSTFRPPKLRWSREKWLYKPTQEVVDDDDPRVPRTIDESKKHRKTWYMVGSQADVVGGHYRRDIVPNTTGDVEPRYTATWHPDGGAAEVLVRGSGAQAYSACVRHYQSNSDR